MEISGTVQSIIFRNQENGYTVLSLFDEAAKNYYTACGCMPLADAGVEVALQGELRFHQKYGEQFIVSAYTVRAPSTLGAIEAYLTSGVVKGIGTATAKLILDAFGMDSLTVLEQQPEKLLTIPGIGPKRLAMITDSFRENKTMRDILLALEPYGITVSQACRLYNVYGDLALLRIQENPYQLIDDITGIGFLTADAIARKVSGFEEGSIARIFAGIKFALRDSQTEYGHTCLPAEKLVLKASQLLGVDIHLTEEALNEMIAEKSLVSFSIEEVPYAASPYLAAAEREIAQSLLAHAENTCAPIPFDFTRYEKDNKITLSPGQRSAVETALKSGLLIITGGPGTGKTTIIRCITAALEEAGYSFSLAAPTGRASKRMSDATGYDSSTLHRLLEYNPQEGFVRNADYPLEDDVLIIDEMSMVDVPLMHAFLKAVPAKTRLILVGDADQLPSVGCGDVLRDIIACRALPVIALTEIFRQAERSAIVVNAHRINNGEMPYLEDPDSDFLFTETMTPELTAMAIRDICSRDYRRLGVSDPVSEIQVLSPMKKGAAGVENLNRILQEALNPPSPKKAEHSFGMMLLREGDKIMQIKNNYKQEWTKYFKNGSSCDGAGVFNGDLGTVTKLDKLNRILYILFDDGRLAEYDFTQADELDLAYCISIHKSQGSEFPAVLLALSTGPAMLLNRNLLYTGVTRAKSLVCCVGRRDVIARMVRTVVSRRRYTRLAHLLKNAADTVTERASL